jgi:hypothetical protein
VKIPGTFGFQPCSSPSRSFSATTVLSPCLPDSRDAAGRAGFSMPVFHADAIYVSARQTVPMDIAPARKLTVLLITLLCAIVISRVLSNIVLIALGLTGISAFIAGFILYAAVFFGVLYLFERFAGVRIFQLGRV